MGQVEAARLIGELEPIVVDIALRYGVPERDLRPRALLSAYARFNSSGPGSMDSLRVAINDEAVKLSQTLGDFYARYPRPSRTPSARELSCRSLSREEVRCIFGDLHYLRRIPGEVETLAGVDPEADIPVVAVAYGRSRWGKLRTTVRRALKIPRVQVVDVARVYSFDSTPRNSASWILSRLLARVRAQSPNVRILSTVVDTSFGFTGASYRSAGWDHLATANSRPYTYVDGEYVTLGELKEKYGTSDIGTLRNLLRDRFVVSDPLLQGPSLVFGRSTQRGLSETPQVKTIARYWTGDSHLDEGSNMIEGEQHDHRADQ